jgi:hypothetical protein
MCKTCGESFYHLFLHCMVATKLWSMILQLFGVGWVMPRSVIEMLGSWTGQRGSRLLVLICRMVLLCLMWCLWKEQNVRSFEDCETGSLNLKKLIIQTLFTWRVTLQSISDCSYSNFFRFVFFFFGLGVSCIHPVYFRLLPSALFFFNVLVKKKKNSSKVLSRSLKLL